MVQLASLLAGVARYLAEAHEPWDEHAAALGSGEPVDAVAVSASPAAPTFDELETSPATADLVSQIRSSRQLLRWTQNSSYTDPEFLGRYAYCELLGPKGQVFNDRISAGLLYLAPKTRYPAHAHPAEEIYHLLAGPSEWQVGSGNPEQRLPGDRMVHGSGVAHSMRSGSSPMVALYLWRGNIGSPAVFV